MNEEFRLPTDEEVAAYREVYRTRPMHCPGCKQERPAHTIRPTLARSGKYVYRCEECTYR